MSRICDERLVPQVVMLGRSLLCAQQQRHNSSSTCCSDGPLRVYCLLNCDFGHSAAPSAETTTHIAVTVAVWQQLGVDMRHVEFRVWNQTCGDNMHSKMVIVDGESVNIGSGNVQFAFEERHQAGLPVEWGENGITLHNSPRHAQQCRRQFFRLFNDDKDGSSCCGGSNNGPTPPARRVSRSYTYPFQQTLLRRCSRNHQLAMQRLLLSTTTAPKPVSLATLYHVLPSTFASIEEWEQHHNLLCSKRERFAVDSQSVSIMHSFPVGSIWNRRWAPEFSTLLQRMSSAQNTIHIMTPNFNEMLLWKTVLAAARRGVDVRIVCGRNFNDIPAVKWAIGFRSNYDMYRSTIVPALQREPEAVQRRIQWRWYGFDDVASPSTQSASIMMTSTSPHSAHEKLILIDSRYAVFGSFNCTTVSAFNAAEMLVEVDSPTICESVWQTHALPRWRSAVDADINPEAHDNDY